jgi:hypothetical protein
MAEQILYNCSTKLTLGLESFSTQTKMMETFGSENKN